MVGTIERTYIATPRLSLRPFRRRDIDMLHTSASESMSELSRWLPWASGAYTRSMAQTYIRDSMSAWNEGRAFDFAMRTVEDRPRHVGNVSVWFTSAQNKTGEAGYWTRTPDTGKGYMTEAVASILDFAFRDLAMHRVAVRVAVGNAASVKIAEKLGFTYEGTLRQVIQVGSEWLDHTSWSLLASEHAQHRHSYEQEGWVMPR
ncbi:MAG: GNAT family N-acetyltransferase [Acidimicrobiia bacterium]|nr:GNAT family N-acetyltransferase [Acidimicrobiia bacterium]